MNTKINDSVFNSFPILKTNRLILRNYNDSDVQDLFAIRSNPRVMEFMDSPMLQTTIESREMIAMMTNSFTEGKGINWALENRSNGKMIGYIGFWRIMPDRARAEIGYALKPCCWGKGYMKEAALEALKFGFEELHLHSVEANINPANHASSGLLKSLGFSKEAHFRENYFFDGHFVDSIIFSLLETDIWH